MRVLPGVAIHCSAGGNAQDARFTRSGYPLRCGWKRAGCAFYQGWLSIALREETRKMRVLPGAAILCAAGGNAQDARFTRGGFSVCSVYSKVHSADAAGSRISKGWICLCPHSHYNGQTGRILLLVTQFGKHIFNYIAIAHKLKSVFRI